MYICAYKCVNFKELEFKVEFQDKMLFAESFGNIFNL